MRYVEGTDLRELLHRYRALDAVTKTIAVGPGVFAVTTGSELVWLSTVSLNSRT